MVLSSGIIYGYYAFILKIDEEDFGGHGALLQEGLFASVSLFLVFKQFPRISLRFKHDLSADCVHELTLHFYILFSVDQLAWILVYSLAHF